MTAKNKGNIIIVECMSTGTNFIADLFNRGYHPVILDTISPDSEIGDQYDESKIEEHNNIPYDFDLIKEADSYEETLELVKKWDPVLILPGSELGVVLANRLAYDLNLKGNDIKNIDSMTLKHEMQNRIAQKGLRSIKGKVVESVEEAIEFYDGEELSQVVLKPVHGAASGGVRICINRDEMIKSLNELLGKTNFFGEDLNKLLIQERIVGDEYIVNTVSCEGQHRVTTVWKYNKIKTSDGAIVYDTMGTVNELNLGEAEMIEYAYDVADALGIKWGPVHGEYMIDEKGPVLIEVNCRPCGGHMAAEFLDKISGQHETDSILDAYLNPERFHEQSKNRYELYCHGVLKFFIVPRNIIAISSPMKNMSYRLKSHIKTSIELDDEDKKEFFKTVDLDTCGIVYMANENYEVLQNDINYLRNVEKHAFSLVLSEETQETKNIEIDFDEIKNLIKECSTYGTGIFITDNIIPEIDILQISPDNVAEIKSDFDFVIVNLNKTILENNTSDLINTIINIFEKIKTGGSIFIPESTYKLFPSERRELEALIKLVDLKIELPPYGIKNYIVASKR